jgi:hypothetical protein
MIGANCDTCICNKAFTQFVNWVIDTKPYFPGGQFISLPSAPFVSDFQQVIKNCNGVIVTTINAQLMNNSDVRITMYGNANVYGGEIFLKAPSGNINYWEMADSISCIKYLGVEEIFDLAGGTLFTVSNQAHPVKILIRPNCILEKCTDPGLSCPPTKQAEYLSQVFNTLISQQQLDKTLTVGSTSTSVRDLRPISTRSPISNPISTGPGNFRMQRPRRHAFEQPGQLSLYADISRRHGPQHRSATSFPLRPTPRRSIRPPVIRITP